LPVFVTPNIRGVVWRVLDADAAVEQALLSVADLVRMYLCAQPTDMRKSFDTLASLLRDGMDGDPLSGHLFVFRSRRGDRVKRSLRPGWLSSLLT
jgi:hypothetical protein